MKIQKHLDNIKNIQANLNDRYTQAMINLDAMNKQCGGRTLNGDFVLDRELAIAYFANNKHKIDYVTPDSYEK